MVLFLFLWPSAAEAEEEDEEAAEDEEEEEEAAAALSRSAEDRAPSPRTSPGTTTDGTDKQKPSG